MEGRKMARRRRGTRSVTVGALTLPKNLVVKDTASASSTPALSIKADAIGGAEGTSGLSPSALRIAISGLTGAVAGAGVGAARKKHGKDLVVHSAVGGVAGVLAALIYNSTQGEDVSVSTDAVEKAVNGKIISSGLSRGGGLVTTASAPPSQAAIDSMNNRGPKGWLAQLLQHGGLCTSFEIDYLKTHRHLGPILKTHWSASDGLQTEYSASTVMCNRFVETQSPNWDWMAPNLWCSRMGMEKIDWRRAADSASETLSPEGLGVDAMSSRGPYPQRGTRADKALKISLLGTINRPGHGAYGTEDSPQRVGRSVFGSQAVIGRNYAQHPDGQFKWGELKDRIGVSPSGHKPAQHVLDWIHEVKTHKHQTDGRHVHLGTSALEANKDNQLTIPTFWDVNIDRRTEWTGRMCSWLDSAQWYVWACEMARLHHADGRSRECPRWWAEHCNRWGIAVPKKSMQMARPTYVEYTFADADDTDSPFYELGGGTVLDLNWTWQYWEKIARTLIKVTSIPGARGYCGEQISPYGTWRHVLDMPVNCGMIPPAMLQGGIANSFLFGNWIQHTDLRNATEKIWYPIAQIFASFVMSFASGLAQVVLTIVEAGIAVVVKLVEWITALANGKSWSWSEAGDVLWDIGKVAVAAVQAAGVSADIDMSKLTDVMPDGVWDALTTAGAYVPGWEGVAEGNLGALAKDLQNTMTNLRDGWKWDYLDEAYSTLVAGSVALSVEG